MIKEEYLDVNITVRNITYYKNKDYKVELGNTFKIKIEDVNPKSDIQITAICDCGKETSLKLSKYYINKNRCGFYGCKACSIKKREILSMERHGVSNPGKLQSVKDKFENTIYERYGRRKLSHIEEFKEKAIQTNLDKRGVKYALSSKEVRDKGKETLKKIYGVEHYSKTEESKENMREIWRNKTDEEMKIRYDKSKETSYINYGVSSYSKTEKHRILSSKLFSNKENVFNRTKSRLDNIINEWNILLEDKFEIIEYVYNSYMIKDLTTNDIFEISTDNLWYRYNSNLSLNTILFPIDTKQSIMEKMIISFLREDNEVIEGDRTLLGNGKEVDIYLPKHRFGIEIDGLYWHSNLYKPYDYHINKTLLAKHNVIDLMHIYDSDWIRNEDIVKSYINNYLGKNIDILFENCELKEILYDEATQFFNKNCLMKIDNSDDNKGLYIGDVLYGVYNINGSYIRFCNKIGFNILNIESIKNFYNIDLIMVFENRLLDYKNIKKYKSLKISEPNIFYLKNGILVEEETEIKFFDCGNIYLEL